MKKYASFFIALCITYASQAQTENRIHGQFFIGAFASPDLSFSKIDRINNSYPHIANFNNGHLDLPRLSFTTGLEALYQINEHFAITLGAQYSSKGGKTKLIIYEKGPAYNSDIRYVYHFRFIDVPLRLDYYFNNNKIAPFISTGISTNVAIGQLTTSYNPRAFYNENSQGFSSINFQFQLGAGVDINFGKSRLRVFTLYRLSILKSDLGIDQGYYSSGYLVKKVTGRLFSVGLGVSYIFRLGHNKYPKATINGTRDL